MKMRFLGGGRIAVFAATVIVVLTSIACLRLAGFGIEMESRLRIQERGGKLLAELALPDGRFEHVFIHSINKTAVEEFFRVDEKGELSLYELRYQDTAVGMPSDVEGGFQLEGGRFILSMNRVFKSVLIAVSPIPGHGIRIGDRYWPFTDWAEQGGSILISGRRVHVVRKGRQSE